MSSTRMPVTQLVAVGLAVALLLLGAGALVVQFLRPEPVGPTVRTSAAPPTQALDPDEVEGASDDWPAESPDHAEPSVHADGHDHGPHLDGEPPSHAEIVTALGPGAAASAVTVASSFAAAFARPSDKVGEQAWWARVEPFFTVQGADDYLWTDPSQVGYTRVLGPARLREVQDEGLVVVLEIPTDSGDYTVTVTGDDRWPGGWAAMSIVPPYDPTDPAADPQDGDLLGIGR